MLTLGICFPFLRAARIRDEYVEFYVALNKPSSNDFMRMCAALTSPLERKRNRDYCESASFVHKRIGNYPWRIA